MKGWIEVINIVDKSEAKLAVNIANIAFIKDIGDHGYTNKSRIFFNAPVKESQAYISVSATYDELLALIESAK